MRLIPLAMILAIGLAFCEAEAQQNPKDEADMLYKLSGKLDGTKTDSLKLLSNRISALSIKAKYDRGILRSKLIGAIYALNKFKLDSASTLLTECEAVIIKNPDLKNSLDEGILHYYRGQILFRKMLLDESDIAGRTALAIFEMQNDLYMMGAIYTQFGVVEGLRGNQHKALGDFLKAYKLKLESGVTPARLRPDIEKIGESYLKMGQYEKSLEYFRKIRNTFVAISPDHLVLGNLYSNLGKTKSELGENDSALFYFQQARRIAEKNKHATLNTMVNTLVADLFTSTNRYAESNALILPVLRQAGHSRFSPMAASARVTASTNFLHLKKYDSAMLLAKQGYALSKEDDSMQALFAKIISETFEAKGRSDSALYYLKKHSEANTSLFSIDNQKKLSTLYAEIETLSKQNEIDALEKQKVVNQTEKKFLIWASAFGAITFSLIILTLRLQYTNRKKALTVEKLQLQKELDLKERDLQTQALKMIYLNNGITEIETNLKKLQPGTEGSKVQQLLNTIHINKSLEKEWDNFDKYFSGVHADFYEKINSRYKNLSISEARLAGLIRMNLTNSEIASILNIESNSVKMAKYRLKKKIGLTDEDDIHSFISKL